LAKISKLPVDKIVSAEYFITREIKFISEEQFSEDIWRSAYNLVKNVDLDDIAFVALSKHLRCKLWTGVGILIRGLIKNGFKNTSKSSRSLYALMLFICTSTVSIV